MNPKTMTTEVPSAEELIRRAEAMIPALLKRAAQVERDRMVSREIIAEMAAAGFFRVLQPRCWGGYEMNPLVYIEIIMRLAQGCMSTAWIYGVQGAQPFMLVKFDERAQQDVWGGDADTLMCSTLQPSTSVVKIMEGGYRLTGRWSYLSGSHYSEWLGVGGVLPEDSAKPGERRLFLLPRSD